MDQFKGTRSRGIRAQRARSCLSHSFSPGERSAGRHIWPLLSRPVLPPKIVEKDVWICWTLEVIYGQPDHFPMAFKGGTSLSKVFDVIDRFSEDIDITVTLPVHNPMEIPVSGSQRKKVTKKVEAALDAHLDSTVVPLLIAGLDNYSSDPGGCVSKIDSETVVLDYPSCYSKEGGYLTERVKVEFGARNQVTPSESHPVTPYVRKVLTDAFSLPTPMVDVLAGERTFGRRRPWRTTSATGPT